MEKLGIAIIGGGPAGLAAGIYAARGGANVKLFEELFPGGQIVKTHRVENTLLRDGRIYLDYLIEIKGASAERSKFTIQVVSEEGTRLFS